MYFIILAFFIFFSRSNLTAMEQKNTKTKTPEYKKQKQSPPGSPVCRLDPNFPNVSQGIDYHKKWKQVMDERKREKKENN